MISLHSTDTAAVAGIKYAGIEINDSSIYVRRAYSFAAYKCIFTIKLECRILFLGKEGFFCFM